MIGYDGNYTGETKKSTSGDRSTALIINVAVKQFGRKLACLTAVRVGFDIALLSVSPTEQKGVFERSARLSRKVSVFALGGQPTFPQCTKSSGLL